MTIVGDRVVTLASGAARCDIVPSIGGAIAGFWWERDGQRIDWLRPTSRAALAEGDARHLGCFPMVPYGSRIRSGRFLFCGREVIESPPTPDTRHTMHGHGWRQQWTVIERTEDRIVLEYDHAPDAWPWSYRARQSIALTPESLTISLDVENLSDGLMPAGLGFHPFFPRTPNATLTAAATGVWLTDAEIMPVERTTVPPHWDLSSGRRVAELALDNVFTGWTGKAILTWPERSAALALEASQPLLSFLVIHTPRNDDFFCVEPASHCTDAINLAREGVAETGLRVLAPGVRRSATVKLSPEFV
jgi:aldose 1-epimerase